jgi:hypothetical protein
MSDELRAKLPCLALAAIVALYVASALVYAEAERPNQDEGWYLYAARLVKGGQRPYRDFAYVQPPLMPYVYGALGGARSVEAGRNLGVLFGALAVLLTALAAWRAGAAAGSPGAGLLAAALLAFCPFVASQQSIVKTYALANACMAGGLLLALRARGRPKFVAAAAAVFSLAALTRNSAATALLAYWLWLAADRERRHLLAAAVPGGLLLPLLFLAPFAFGDAEALRYNLLGHHAEQTGGGNLLLTATVLVGQMAHAAPALATLVIAGLALQRGVPADVEGRAEVDLLALVCGLVAVGHLVSKHPYQEYQALAMPAAAALGGWCWGRILAASGERRTLGVLLAALAGVTPLLAGGAARAELAGFHRPGGIFGPLHAVCRLVAAHSRPEEPIFTFQTDVAIETPRPLSPGLTLASFSVIDDDARARRLHLTSPGLMREEFETARPAVVVLSPGDVSNVLHARWTPDDHLVVDPGLDDHGRTLYAPLVAALDAHYEAVGRVPQVGQFAEEFTVLARRKSP